MTQKEQILKLIINAGSNGISTNELRNATHAVDVPKCVSDLNKQGHGIKSIENGDGTVTYFIEYQLDKQWVQMPNGNYAWVNKGLKKVQAKPRGKKKVVDRWWEQPYTLRDQQGNVVNL